MNLKQPFSSPPSYRMIRLLVFSAFLISFNIPAWAQFSDVPVTGYNADVVGDGATGAGINSTTADVDGVNWIFVSTTFNPGSGICAAGATGLPATNQITSTRTPGLTYNLQPYTANNSLRLASGTSGTLTLTTPISASNLYLLALGGSGACAINVTITFTDLSTQTVSSSVNDWCSGTNAASGVFYRINRNDATCTGGTCQYFYESNLAILPANYGKTIASISIASTGGILNVMGVGAKAPCATPTAQPTALTTGTVTTSTIGLSFTAPSPAATGVLVVRYPMGATPTAPVNGTYYAANQTLGLGTIVDTSTFLTAFTASGLSGSSSYDFYAYSYNDGTTCGGPIYLTTTPLTGTIATAACSGTMAGTVMIGPGLPNTVAGGYTSLTNAFAHINANGLAGNTILELQNGYDGTSTNETFPIAFSNNPCLTASRALTIRPAAGVSGALTITSSNAGATILFDGADFITIDGRAGGTGTTKYLNIINTNAGGAALQFSNDARNNTVTYCDVQGQNTSATTTTLAGVIYFGAANTSILTGNDNNTISFCDVHGTIGGTPTIGISSYGSTTNAGSWNDNNTITDCNIYDFFSATTATTGIKLENGSNAFTISNNRFYQTVTRNYTTAAAHRILWLTPVTTNASSPCAFQVINNFIGGNSSAGTGTYTLTGTGVYFWGVDINHWGTAPSSIQGNTITNISLSSTITSTTNDFFRGISTGSAGNVNIGTITGNTIGSSTVNNAIVLATTGTGTNAYGIRVASTSNSTDTINIYNNTIGGIIDSSNTSTSSAHLYGIAITSGSFTNIVNNTIGSSTMANSLNSPNPSTATQNVMGISISTGLTNHVVTITGNTIANLNNGYVGASTGYTRGIAALSSARTTITNNNINNLYTSSTYTGSATLACLMGIIANTSNVMTVTGNTIHTLVLANPSSTAASYIEGIYIGANGNTPTHPVSKNFIHSFDIVSTTNTNAVIYGIDIVGGSNIVSNNMIRLGVKPDGTDLTNAVLIRGIYLNTGTATNVYHNSVLITGSNVGSTAKNTMAFHRNGTGVHDIRNNVFVNNRSNATLGSGGKHYQLFMNNFTTVTLNNNVYYGSGNDVVFATPNNGGNDSLTYSINWAASGDMGSVAGNPQFIAPTANASTVSLHIHPTNPSAVESSGALIASITDDIDGDIRATSTPNDAGADAGNFTGINMVMDSTIVSSPTSSVVTGSTYQQLLGIKIYTRNSANPVQATSFLLNTALTTSNLNIENARIYYTGASSVFDTASAGLFGTLAVIPSGGYTITGARTLITGVNYFWLACDVKSTAILGNVIDASLDSILFTPTAFPTILAGNPTGTRAIKGPLSGPYNVGAGQTYTTLSAVAADLSILGISGPVTFVLKDALYNTTSGETFPIVFGNVAGASATNTITIVPDASIVSRIEGNSATATIDLNGANNIIIDGRPGGTGTFVLGTNLQIANTATNGPAVRFINEATKNTLRYVDLKSNNNTATATAGAGVVNFGTTTGANGNDSNTIAYCDIHEEAAGFPLIGISSIGSATTVATNNENNKIDNCNIYNFFSAGTATAGVYIGSNNGNWQITNNHVYQTASRTYTGAVSHRAFWITPNTASLTSASGFVINNNYIGGDAAAGTGTYTMTGTVNYIFYGMDLSLGIGAPSEIQGNTITNMNMTGSNTGSAWYGMNIVNGNVNCGTTTGNLIGSTTTNGAISYTSNSNGGSVLPFRTGGGNAIMLHNNIVSGITLTGSTTTTAVSFFGMNLSGGSVVVADSNYIGYPTLANSITIGANTSTTASVALGIITNPGAITTHAIVGNRICNITNNYSGASTASSVRALHVNPSSTGAFYANGNTIEQITNAATSTGTGVNAATHGLIANMSNASSVSITSNTIRSVNSTATTGAVVTNGIYYAGPASGSHLVSRNLIYSIEPTQPNPAAVVVGVDVNSGTVTVANNMIRLGIDSTGASATSAFTIRGISKNTATSRIYFNTVYIGGTGVGADINRTFAFARLGAGTDTVRNNIFVNQRMNAGPGAGHYALSLNNATTLAMDYNLVRADSIGIFNAIPYQTLSNWKGGSGVDANTVSSAAVLLNPTGGTATIDLHIHPTTPTPIEGAGITDVGLGLNEDFDGQDRTLFTPTDIGADAGNFVPNDVAAPSIVFTPLTNTQLTTDRTITATISDLTAVYLTGTNRPRIYFKKQAAGTFVSAAGTMVSGDSSSSVWSFTISSSALGGVLSNDSIYYYVVAQDSTPANNVGSFPGGVEATDVNTISVHPGTPAAYLITPTVSGTYTVGTSVPCNYNSITQALNLLSVSFINGPVILELMDTLYDKTTETFPIVISSALGFNATNTLTIRPASGVNAVIRDSITHAVLDLNGIDYLTIDGRQGGTGAPNSLSIENRSVSNAAYGAAVTPNNIANAIRFINDATHNTIKFTNIRGANGTNESGVIFFSIGLVEGNSYNTLDQNNIGDVPDVANPFTIFCGVGSTDALAKYNRNNVISNNNIYNFFAPAGESNAFKVSKGNTAWTITGNHFFQTEPLTGTGGTQYLMNLNRRVGPTVSDDVAAGISLDSMVIAYNTIGGSGPNASGTPWSITGAGPNFSGIYGEYGKNSTMRISNNTFTNFEMNQNTTGNRWVAINLFNGLANIDSNVIGSVNANNAIVVTSTVNGTGIIGIATNYSATTTPAGTTRIRHNQLGGVTLNGNATTSVNFTGISVANTGGNNSQTYLIENNTIGNGLADNIITAGASASATTQFMIGINNNTNSANMVVRNNTIQNLTNTYTGTAAGLVHGINITTGIDTISGNTIANLTNATAQTSAATTNTVSVAGILAGSATAGQYIAGNTIRNLWNTNTTAVNTGVVGIQANNTGNGEIVGNTVYNLASSSTAAGAYVYGVSANTTNTIRLYNNMIALGLDTSSVAMTNTPNIYGINRMNSGTLASLHNTVFIQGANVGSGTGTTAAYARMGSGSDSLINNILVNTRSNTSTGGAHYVVNLNGTSALISKNNILQTGLASAGDTLVGLTGSIGYELLSAWNTFSGLEVGSKDTTVAFVSNTDLHLAASMFGVMTLKGIQLDITRDIDNSLRVANAPYIGADEIATAPLPVQLVHVSAVAQQADVLITWITASEINNKGFYVQRSVDGKTFNNITFVEGTNSTQTSRYKTLDIAAFTTTQSPVLYYRIYQVDMDGKVSVSEVVTVRQATSKASMNVSVYPNPVVDVCTIQFESASTETAKLTITDIQGKVVNKQAYTVQQGVNTIQPQGINTLEQGMYFVNVTVNGSTTTVKLLKR